MDSVSQKQCSKCGEWKDKSEFHKQAGKKDGTRPRCKSCTREDLRNWRATNNERARERDKDWYHQNPEKRRANSKRYRENNLVKILEKGRRYYQDNAEKIKKHVLEWQKKFPEKVNKKNSKWIKAHPEKRLARARHHRENNRDKYTWYTKNRKALQKSAGVNITPAQWESLKKFYNYTCLRCGRKEPDIKLTHDHVIPLSKGGLNALENSQCLCKSCNSSKGAKHVDYRPVIFYG